jgi:hypothetical protein
VLFFFFLVVLIIKFGVCEKGQYEEFTLLLCVFEGKSGSGQAQDSNVLFNFLVVQFYFLIQVQVKSEVDYYLVLPKRVNSVD